jgi:hypothetical protein
MIVNRFESVKMRIEEKMQMMRDPGQRLSERQQFFYPYKEGALPRALHGGIQYPQYFCVEEGGKGFQ